VIFYEKVDKTKPVADFLGSLEPKMKVKALREIQLLKECGNELREPYSKHLQDGIYELRIKQGSNISRIFYFFFVGKTIVMTNGFIKKTQKTPQLELEKAIKYKDDYERRMCDG
jgi:phage-related protein